MIFHYNVTFMRRKALRALTEYFVQKNVLFKEIESIEPKSLGSRKKIAIYAGVGIDKNYYAIFIVEAKSRFLRKNADDLMMLCSLLVEYKEHNFKKKILLISSPLCSKAKSYLKENGWKVSTDYK